MEGAVRLFAGEWAKSTLTVPGEDDRSASWVVTPTGAYCRQVFLAGALTEVQEQSDMLSARLADPTGGFDLVFGGRNTSLAESIRKIPLPSFVSVSGRAQMYRTGGKVVLTIRPEHILVVDRRIRDQWIIKTAAATLARLETMNAVLQDRSADSRARQVAEHYSLTQRNLADLAIMAENALSNVRPPEEKAGFSLPDSRAIILEYIRAASGPRGLAVEEIIEKALSNGISQETVLTVLGTLITDDECYQPQKGFVKLL